MTKRKPLTWHPVGVGELPGCDRCAAMLIDPMFTEAVYSTAIEHPGNPADMAKRAINHFHEKGHVDG